MEDPRTYDPIMKESYFNAMARSPACNYLRFSLPVATPKGEMTYNITVFAEKEDILVVESWELTDPSITSHVPGWIGVQTLDLDEVEMIHFDAVPSHYYGSSEDALTTQSIWGISGVAHFPSIHASRGAWAYGDKHRIVFEEDVVDLGV